MALLNLKLNTCIMQHSISSLVIVNPYIRSICYEILVWER